MKNNALQPNKAVKPNSEVSWFDPFTRTMLITMFVLLFAIFASAKYMDAHNMTGVGTDDTVNQMAAVVSHQQPHPFINLPGDAQVGAFSVANFFVGMIVGHNWQKLFPEPKPEE